MEEDMFERPFVEDILKETEETQNELNVAVIISFD